MTGLRSSDDRTIYPKSVKAAQIFNIANKSFNQIKCMKNQNNVLSARDDNGNPVDWWFLYKIAGKSVASDGSRATGNEYVYFDSSGPQGKKLTLSPNLISDTSKGAVSNTLN